VTRVLVMGLGRFGGGVAAARHFARAGAEVLVTDLRRPEELAPSLAAIEPLGVRTRLGAHDPADFAWADTVVVNPAVAFDDPLVRGARARGAAIVTEIGLTLDLLRCPVVAVSGTKGKSTTTALAAAMLEASGRRAWLGGNIGRPLLNEAASIPADAVAVLELSSFQLAWLEHDRLRPAAAVITNVTGDHFDHHGNFEAYAAAKRRLADAVPPGATLVLRDGDAACREFARTARGKVVWFGGAHAPPVPLDRLRLLGEHNRDNAAAAAHAALAAGATVHGCREALAGFTGLPHRLERVLEARGVLFVNDSIATTPEAAAAAVAAFERPIVLLAGGRDKGLDWRPLLDAARRARAVVAYGETGAALVGRLPGARFEEAFDDAVRCALRVAAPGDVVLLSPGFASLDQFPGFDARGERFRALVSGAL